MSYVTGNYDYRQHLDDAYNILGSGLQDSKDRDFKVAAAQVWALMALAAAVGDVAEALRSETGQQ